MERDWIHELRNALNTLATNAAVVDMLLKKDEAPRALAFNQEVLKACERCCELLESAPPTLS